MRPAYALVVVLGLGACDVNLKEVEVLYTESSSLVDGELTIAAGLDTYVAIRVDGPLGYSRPDGLTIIADQPRAIEMETLGPVAFRATGEIDTYSDDDQGTIMRLRPLAIGVNRLRLLTDDTDESHTVVIHAVPVDRVRFDSAKGASSDVDATLISFGGQVDLEPTFLNGSTPVHASGPIVVDSELDTVSGPPLRRPRLPIDGSRHVSVVSVPSLDGSLSVIGVDESDIAGVGIGDDETEFPVVADVGDMIVLDVFPLTETDERMWGRPPAHQTSVSGESVSVALSSTDKIILNADGPGSSTLTIGWGAVVRDVEVIVSEPGQ